MARAITISLAPNTTRTDAWRALQLLLQPWRWQHGPEREILTERLQEMFGVKTVSLVSSGRWALFLLLRALNLPENDEVLLQGYTCVSVPGPVLWAGLRPVYVDIHPTTLTMDPADVEKKLTLRSRVLIIQHTFGSPAHLTELLQIANEHRLIVIEDCAHTIGARYKGKFVGTFGDAAVFSFGRDKALSSVFGGALLVSRPERFPGLQRERNTLQESPRWWILQQLLHPVLFVWWIRPLYFTFGVGKAALVVLQTLGVLSKAIAPEEKRGGRPSLPAARLPNALAVLALAQLDRLSSLNEKRRALSAVYAECLAGVAGVVLPTAPAGAEPISLRYTIQTPHAEEIRRAARRAHFLLGDWYDAVIAPQDTDLRTVGYLPGTCPVAERVAERSLNLPTNPFLQEADALRVSATVKRLLQRSQDQNRVNTMMVRDVREKHEWETFVRSRKPNTFLHSWNWAEMHRMLAERAYPLGAFRGSELVGIALGLTVSARRGAFFFCPHGPLVRGTRQEQGSIHAALLDALRTRARREGSAFLRVSPLLPDNPEWRAFFRDRGFRPAPIHMHAETMWVLDIRPTEEELLQNMRKTTRNLIRRAEREGITVRRSADPADLKTFEELYQETAHRERFVPFSREFLEAEFRAFRTDDRAFLFFAEDRGDVLATALVITHGNVAFYHQGASSRKRPKVPAAVLLQWEIIRTLKRRGIDTYNFWGIAPTNDPQHPWHGLTLFKQGFGGRRADYLHAQDLPLRMSYWLTFVFERARSWKRGL